MSAPILAQLEQLPHHQHHGAEHSARCPAHDDKVASLSWREGDDGRALISCHAGCSAEAIVGAIGADMKDLFTPRDHETEPEVVKVTEYEIRDFAGNVIAVHVRRDLADGSKRVHWKGGLGGRRVATLPLYGTERAPRWPAGSSIVIVEGEKAADAVMAVGKPALGTFGAEHKPDPVALELLRGRDVILWPDHDPPGIRHMQDLARRLDGIAASVKWIEPIGPKGHDAADELGLADDPRKALMEVAQRIGPVPTEATAPEPDERHEKGKLTQAERLRAAVDEAEVEFFHDSEFRAYATFPRLEHRETWPVRSAGFRRYVTFLMYQQQGKAPRAADLADFINMVEGKAQFDGPMVPVHVRIAPTDAGLALDLGDEGWTAVEVDAGGWRHVERPSVRFIRPRGMLALPVPVQGGSLDELRPFLNVRDDDAWALLIGVLIMMFRPTGPYPVLGVHGEQGAAKSTAMRVLRKLVDPRETMDRAAPRNDHDLAIHAMHNRVVALDNVSGLPDWLSDALARLATGAGFSTRQLYSDSDEFSFAAARPVMLNGIGEVISRSDLLDRAVLVDLEPIGEAQRKLEADFWRAFDAARPRILGAVLDAVSTAIRREPTITMAGWPRMADFARWVTAAEPGLGWADGTFLAAYHGNRANANEMALDADPVASAIRQMMEMNSEWTGRASELLDRLAAIAGETAVHRKNWPAASNQLSNRVERLAPNLRRIGIEIERHKGGKGQRTITIRRGDGTGNLYTSTRPDEAGDHDVDGSDGQMHNGRDPSPPSPPSADPRTNQGGDADGHHRHPSPPIATQDGRAEREGGAGGDGGDALHGFYNTFDGAA